MGIEIIGAGQGTDYRGMVSTHRKLKSENGPVPFETGKAGGRAADVLPGFQTKGEDAYLNEALEQLRTVSDIFNRRLDFEVNEDTGRIVVKVIDTKTDKVVKEIPPEQLVQLAAKIQDMIGVLVDEER